MRVPLLNARLLNFAMVAGSRFVLPVPGRTGLIVLYLALTVLYVPVVGPCGIAYSRVPLQVIGG